ncbi:CBS domain protein [Scopulibacillus darangshiensis]|uniref:CBS domain protein n=1 Tax=Scopulibacillus darangshiensis TaxID=442528 RepID=A0A4R2P5B1_9BACL|nr:CBS domain-containing protein [Scopulibacillus darangshiensis]TCP28965.1 CBS domain protein [Scopulibacillus darangshiensis]
MKIRDFMIDDVIYVTKDESIRSLLKKLVEYKIGGVPVIDHEQKLIGVVSDGDVLRAITPKEQTIYDFYSLVIRLEKQDLGHKVKELMDDSVDKIMTKRKIHYVYPDDDFEQVLTILSKHHFKKIPVIDRADKIVGVVSRGDVIRHISQQIIKNEQGLE